MRSRRWRRSSSPRGRRDAVRRGLLQLDLWHNDVRTIEVATPRADCPCCGGREFPFLERRKGSAASLCGRDAVQITRTEGGSFPYDAVRERLARGSVELDDRELLLRFEADGLAVTLFRDGRAIVKGTSDAGVARALYDRFIGS